MNSQSNEGSSANSRYRVLIVENDPDYRQDHVKNIGTDWGYTVIVAEGQGPALLEDAKAKVRRHRCHACVVDMRLLDDGDRADRRGLDLTKDLLPARSVIVTGFGNVELTNRVHIDEIATALVGKEDGPDALQFWLEKALQDFQCPHRHAISSDLLTDELPARLRFSKDDSEVAEEIDLILSYLSEKLFPEADLVEIAPLPRATDSSSPDMQAIRHHAIVVKGMARGVQPVAIKITSPDRIQLERERYHTYIDRRVSGHFHSQLECSFRFWNLAGSAYSFLGQGQQQQTFSNFYRSISASAESSSAEPASAELFAPVRHLLTEVWGELYAERKPLNETLFDSYETFRRSPKKTDGPLRLKFSAWQQLSDSISLPHLTGKFPDPRKWICNHHGQSQFVNAQQCVVQGDLHGDNLFVDNSHAWVIDFERTGYAHVLCDITELEQDIITRLAEFTAADSRVIHELAIALTRPDTPQDPLRATAGIEADDKAQRAFYFVRELRLVAAELTQYKDQREYYWALLLDCLFVIAKLEQDIANSSACLNTAMILASVLCRRLDEN